MILNKTIKPLKINVLEREHNDEISISIIPEVLSRDKLVMYDYEGKPLQRRVGF